MVARYLAYLVWAEGLFLLPSILVGALYREGTGLWLLITSLLCGVLGLGLFLASRKTKGVIYAREGFAVAGVGWLLLSLLGCLPFWLSGEIPQFIDAFFEAVSGFTTTGATILPDVEALSNCLLFWRCFSHWLGGIGVLVFILGIVRGQSGAGFTMHLLRAESAGPQVGKIRAKTRDSVRYLAYIYLGLTIICLLFLLLGGMPLFDAVCTAMSTAGTGGFGIKNDSMNSYTAYIQIVVTVFMLLFGISFPLYYLMLQRQWRQVLRDSELRLYIGIFVGATVCITASLFLFGGMGLGQSLHESSFVASSILTTTGYSLGDFNNWPGFSRSMILVLMLFGGMAGSTAGGFKTGRTLILLKSMQAGLHRLLHPRSVKAVKVNGKTVDDNVLRGAFLFLSVYCAIAIGSFILISVDGFSLETNLSAAISSLNNIGPGFGSIGPEDSFAAYSVFSKLVLIFNMLVGRLEIFPILLLASPAMWKRKA